MVDHFFCLDSKVKKHEAVRLRFMHRRCASYGEAVLHKNAFSDEAAPVFISLRRGKPFHFAMKHCSVTLHNMKHSAYAPYDLSSIALRATDDEKNGKRELCLQIFLVYAAWFSGKEKSHGKNFK